MKPTIKDVVFSSKQEAFLNQPFNKLFEVNEGTPRSGKTTADIFRLAELYQITGDSNHMVTAYNQEQAYRLWIEGNGIGLAYYFDGMSSLKRDRDGDHLEISLPNGVKRVYFKGGAKSNSVGAITGMTLGSVAYSEINLLNKDFIDETFRRTIAADIRYHLADLNPPAPLHPVLETFDRYDARWQHWTIQDNPILTDKRKQEVYEELSKNPYLFKRDWLGERVMPQGVIYSMFNQETMTTATLIGEPVELFFATDSGQNDATTMSANIVTRVHENGEWRFVLNRFANYYHSGTETGETKAMSEYAVELKQFIQWVQAQTNLFKNTVLVDPAAKALRAELERVGVYTQKANNNAQEHIASARGIDVGIERLQNLMVNNQFRLVEQNSNYDHYHYIKEVGLYMRDPVTGKPVDLYNHAQDEARYSANYFYSNYMR